MNFFKRRYHHLNKITISKEAILHNHQLLQKLQPNSKICPVLKSNAYGHGLKLVAPIFDSLNCPFLIVDSLYEAYELYKLKLKTPILIMGYTNPINFSVKKLPFHIAVFDLETAKVLNKYQPHCPIHIFVDTGMNREGVSLDELPKFLANLKDLKNLQVEGLCSHFADAESENLDFTKLQIENYKRGLEIVQSFGFNPKWRHISASAGGTKIKDDIFNMARVGILHYGVTSSEEIGLKESFKPALEFSSTLAQIKPIKKGNFVGYGCTYKAEKDMVLGLLPAGYYEGVDRRLSNKGFVKIKNTLCPIIGRVSMNMTTIDISQVKDPKIGDKVIIFSADPQDKNSVVNSAKIAQTIPYDLMVHLAESVRRELI